MANPAAIFLFSGSGGKIRAFISTSKSHDYTEDKGLKATSIKNGIHFSLERGDGMPRTIVICLIFIVGAGIFCQVLISKGLMEDPFKGNLDSSVIDAESLEKVPLEPFILPGSQCKASFPGKPHRASNDRKLFPAYAEFGQTYFLADKTRQFSMAEFALPSLDLSAQPNGGDNGLPTAESIGNVFGGTLVSERGAIGRDGVASTASAAADARLVETALAQFTERWVREYASSLDGKKVICKNRIFYGREITGTMKDQVQKYKLRVFCNFNRTSMVMAAVIGSDKDIKSPVTQKFLDSVELW